MSSLTQRSKIYLAIIIVLLAIAIGLLWNSNPQYITHVMVVASLLIYLVVRSQEYKQNDLPKDFFLYNREMPKDEFVPTYVTTNIGLFSSIAFSVVLGYYYGFAGMFFTTTAWFIGMWWFSKQIPELLQFFKTGTTIHEFIAETYGKSDNQKIKLRAWTSAVSAILYFASVGVEVKFGAETFAPTFGEIESTVLAFAIALIGLIYTYLSGYKGVVFTDKIQYYILLIGAFVIYGFILLLGHDKGFSFSNETFNGYFSFPFVALGPDPYGLVGLVILLALYQFCIMDMWQRCIAFANTKDEKNNKLSDEELIAELKKKTFSKAVLPFLFLFIVWFEIGIVVRGVGLTDDLNSILPAFLSSFDSYSSMGYLCKAFVITGFVAAVLSTIDTFLLATVQTFMYDIYGTAFFKGLTSRLDSLDNYQQYRFVNASKFLIVLLGTASVGFAFLTFSIMTFWTSMYSIMLPFFPAVYWAIKGKASEYSFKSAFYSVVIGSGGALLIGIIGTFIYKEPWVVPIAPLFATFSSLAIMKMLK